MTYPYDTNRTVNYTHNNVMYSLLFVVGCLMFVVGATYGGDRCDEKKLDAQVFEP